MNLSVLYIITTVHYGRSNLKTKITNLTLQYFKSYICTVDSYAWNLISSIKVLFLHYCVLGTQIC